jgi:hypothetical protein
MRDIKANGNEELVMRPKCEMKKTVVTHCPMYKETTILTQLTINN